MKTYFLLLTFLFTSCTILSENGPAPVVEVSPVEEMNIQNEETVDSVVVEPDVITLDYLRSVAVPPDGSFVSGRGIETYLDSGFHNGVRAVFISPNVTEYWSNETDCDDQGTGYDCVTYQIDILDANGESYEGIHTIGTYSPDARWMFYNLGSDFHLYDFETRQDVKLMSVSETSEGFDVKFNSESTKLAIVAINSTDPSYMETAGTKLFVFSLDTFGPAFVRNVYPLKIAHVMSDEGFSSSSNYFGFVDKDTLFYYSSDLDETKNTLDL